MAGVRTHEELDVWKLSEEVVVRVRRFLNLPAVRGDFELFDQLRRSSERICPNIAEGFSRFRPKENANFVRIARGSLTEVIVHLETAVAKGYLKRTDIEAACSYARRARGAATVYIRYLEKAKAPETQARGNNDDSPGPGSAKAELDSGPEL